MPIITARFLWAFPSMLNQFLIDLYIITALATVMIMLVSKGILRANRKFKVSRRFQQAGMTLYMYVD
jgi:hypothetical protein